MSRESFPRRRGEVWAALAAVLVIAAACERSGDDATPEPARVVRTADDRTPGITDMNEFLPLAIAIAQEAGA